VSFHGSVDSQYLPGKLRFVSAIHVPSFSSSSLISGGGDPMLKIWDWITGTVKYEIPILADVKPFIKVRAPKRKRGDDDSDGEETPEGRRGRRRKGKGKEMEKNAEIAEPDVDEQAEDHPARENLPSGPLNLNTKHPDVGESIDMSEIVLVLHKIDTLETDQGNHIIFSAVGFVPSHLTYSLVSMMPSQRDGTVYLSIPKRESCNKCSEFQFRKTNS
jgi:tRNA (guanine-N(7)-)-methyltransferase subunit TRM82